MVSNHKPNEQDPWNREQDITATFVRLADSLMSATEEVEMLRDLAESCVRILDVDTAGVALGAGERLGFVVATSEDMNTIELFQSQEQEGPCLEAFRSGETYHCSDLTESDRWPKWRSVAIGLGFRSATAFPMRLGEEIVGALNVYSKRPRRLNDRDAVVGRALADIATVGLVTERTAHRQERTREQLQHALDSRVVIEQAKGILAGEYEISVQDAFDSLRQHARSHNATVSSIAKAIVEIGLRPPHRKA